VPAVSKPGAYAIWDRNNQVLVSDVAARDVQAATSTANPIARAGQSLGALRAAARGNGGRPQAAKSESLNGSEYQRARMNTPVI
jgi:hypothetical protein